MPPRDVLRTYETRAAVLRITSVSSNMTSNTTAARVGQPGVDVAECVMKLHGLALSVVFSGLALSFPALGAGSAEAGQAKSTPCVACHGVDGNSVNPEWPNLAGQGAPYIVRQLKAFKSGERQNVLMSPMAAPLSDEDMEDLAAYYSQQQPAGLEADPAKVAEGQRLYRGGDPVTGIAACTACHGPNGRGMPAAGYPSLQGQHATYIAAQLKAYRSGQRTTDQALNRMMRDVANRLTDDQIETVAQYVQGLR
jgi:cytochrome c553